MAPKVITVTSKSDIEKAYAIRKIVFVEEQKVPLEEEIDKFEDDCIHLLASIDDVPCGACRWRFTAEGAKLERFAVLKEYRGKHVGSALVSACIENILNHTEYKGQQLYLNSQLEAMPLYSRFGFEAVGEKFLECDIEHFKMVQK